jgi:hypothetical protein
MRSQRYNIKNTRDQRSQKREMDREYQTADAAGGALRDGGDSGLRDSEIAIFHELANRERVDLKRPTPYRQQGGTNVPVPSNTPSVCSDKSMDSLRLLLGEDDLPPGFIKPSISSTGQDDPFVPPQFRGTRPVVDTPRAGFREGESPLRGDHTDVPLREWTPFGTMGSFPVKPGSPDRDDALSMSSSTPPSVHHVRTNNRFVNNTPPSDVFDGRPFDHADRGDRSHGRREFDARGEPKRNVDDRSHTRRYMRRTRPVSGRVDGSGNNSDSGTSSVRASGERALDIDKASILHEIRQLQMLNPGTAVVSREVSISDSYESLQLVLYQTKQSVEIASGVSTMKDFLKIGCTGIELSATKFGRGHVDLRGWSSEIARDVNGHSYSAPLQQIYRRFYRSGGGGMNPFLQLVLLLLGSATVFALKQKFMGGGGSGGGGSSLSPGGGSGYDANGKPHADNTPPAPGSRVPFDTNPPMPHNRPKMKRPGAPPHDIPPDSENVQRLASAPMERHGFGEGEMSTAQRQAPFGGMDISSIMMNPAMIQNSMNAVAPFLPQMMSMMRQ